MVVVFAAVLALNSADTATVGANATQLQAGLGIGRSEIGLLPAVSSLLGAAATVPGGMLVDRFNRTRLLADAVICWAVAMVLSSRATSYLFLLLARVALVLGLGALGGVLFGGARRTYPADVAAVSRTQAS